MNEPAYPFRVSDDALSYAFDSISEVKIIHKAVEFRPFSVNPIFYNLALLDVNDDGTADDLVASNNQDMKRVLATVFRSMLTFFDRYPNKLIYFNGSDESGLRNRLYRILIARELEEIQKMFEVHGRLANGNYEEFVPNKPYIGFIFQLRRQDGKGKTNAEK